MVDKITYISNDREKDETLKIFLENFWFSPQDAILRATERLIWNKRKFNEPVLDVGIADGGVSKFLFAGLQKFDVGVDIDEVGIRKARFCGVYKKVLAADACDLPFKNNTFRTY